MGIVFRQSVKTSIVVFSGALLGAAVIWLSTKYNTKQQLGFIGSLTTYVVIFSQIFIFGIGNTLSVFIHRYTADDRKRKVFLTLCLLLPLALLAICTPVYFLLRDWIIHLFKPEDIPFVAEHFNWLPLFTLIFIYMILMEIYLSSQLKVAISAFMREVVVRIANIALILLFGFGYIDFHTLVVGSLSIFAIPMVVCTFLSLRTKAFGLSLDFNAFSKEEYREVVHFTWYHFLLTLSLLLIGQMDAAMLPKYAGFYAVAIYRIAVFFISFLQLPFKAMVTASFPVLAKAFADKDTEKAKDVFVRSSINIFIPSVALGLLLCCNLQNIVAVINNNYSDMIPVFLILFLGSMFNIVTGMNDQVLSITNHYKLNFYLSFTLIIVLFFLLRFLIPTYGMYGAAWATTTTVLIFNFVKFLFVWQKLHMQPFSKSTLLVIIATLPALAVGYFLPRFFDTGHHIYVNTFFDAVLRSSAIMVVYLAMLLWLKPSADLQEYIAQIKKNKRLF